MTPTAADALIPTSTPVDDLASIFSVGWTIWPDNVIKLCGNKTPQPVTNPIFTNDPTASPVTGNVPSPTNSPVSGPLTAYPTTSDGLIGGLESTASDSGADM